MSGITLTLRAPNHADHEVNCQSTSTVYKLKEIIATTHPSKPSIKDQRLIFSGRFILDHETLEQFEKFTTPVVIHLHFTFNTTKNNSTVPPTNELRHRNNIPQQEQTPPQQQPLPQQQQAYQWTHWTPEQIQQYQNYPQYAAMMQHYQASMTHYMQYYSNHQHQFNHGSHHGNQAPPQGNPPADPLANNNANNGEVNAQPAAPNPPMNAQGGFDEVGQRDWLDVLFTLFRYGFFLSILYFYSTLYRFLVVTALFVFFYVYQAGAFNAQRRQNNNTDDNNNNQETDDPPSIFATAWCFFSTFFTSLIPQLPQ